MSTRSARWHWVRRLEENFIGLLLLAITAVIFINVVMRYAFQSSLSWAEEFARYGVIWITFIGSSVCIYRGLHIAVDVWSHKLGPRLDRRWLMGVNVLSALGCGVFFWYSLQLVIKAIHTGQKTIALGLPMWLVYGSMSLGSALMCVRFLALVKPAPRLPDNASPSTDAQSNTDRGTGSC
ncbi:TRAP transporter small permease [Pusillimonas sp. SM2304]|uniref:TRAP transporter small permease n=1 Tax=Pusillimonas sp. SM2304 TaxID=3073241 RepID=UPI0028749FB6|nr:TRAP transporter small permease [Pusillimonas sp. SM2304]MDS1140104.1 TRAP transporter small permease [Pusillimonas sp. SM2304]